MLASTIIELLRFWLNFTYFLFQGWPTIFGIVNDILMVGYDKEGMERVTIFFRNNGLTEEILVSNI